MTQPATEEVNTSTATPPANPFSHALEWYRQNGLPPWATIASLGLGAYGLTRLAWKPFVRTYRSLKRPFLIRGYPGGDAAYDEDTEYLTKDRKTSRLFAGVVGLGGAAVGAGLFMDTNKPWWGLRSWTDTPAAIPASGEYGGSSMPNTPLIKPAEVKPVQQPQQLNKTAALDSYLQELDWQKPLNLATADSLFTPGNGFDADSDLARLTGRAIVNSAAQGPTPGTTTLGGVFDAAMNKIENKLSLSGIASTALKTTVANGAARLFAGALDTVCDLKPSTRNAIIDAGTWAGAISSILN